MSRDTTGLWAISDHVCRVCLGRIVTRNAMFMCSSCEVTSSLRPTAICGCGMAFKPDGKRMPASLHRVYQCGANPEKGPLSPAAIVILYQGEPLRPADAA